MKNLCLRKCAFCNVFTKILQCGTVPFVYESKSHLTHFYMTQWHKGTRQLEKLLSFYNDICLICMSVSIESTSCLRSDIFDCTVNDCPGLDKLAHITHGISLIIQQNV